MKNTVIALTCLTLILHACRKKQDAVSPEKQITSFTFRTAENPQLVRQAEGIVRKDSIYLQIPANATLKTLTPSIEFRGVAISPESGKVADFSSPQLYTVTAADGSVHRYTVVVRVQSGAKEITAFVFKAADNPGLLTADLRGTIRNNSIFVLSAVNAAATLKPFITYTGVSLSPDVVPQAFTGLSFIGSMLKTEAVVRTP